ncbi:MAG TPA: hypothetical protein VFQ61_37440 [Polyangiaceae bacterium]|nr:hypothetical protein [Polyangiaceae bacterium]
MHGDGVWQLTSFSPTAVFVNDSPLAGSIQLEDEDELEILDNYFVFRERDTEDSTYYELIYQLTIQDVPSRLANERIVREALTREAAHASRYRSSLAVASIGLYCEDCRPTALDHYLRDFGEVLRQALGRAVTVGRIDSRELAIVAPNFDAGTLHDNISAAHSIVQTNALTFPPCRIQIEVSAYHEGLTAADLLRKAARSAE